ncbi:MAG: hypothetical protein NT080_01465 [Spirochaetes bacterium]|nr:hypothetical protein [Spirochaetota bacterium]
MMNIALPAVSKTEHDDPAAGHLLEIQRAFGVTEPVHADLA